jgi:rubredoxin
MRTRRKIPWFVRRRISCPECGFIFGSLSAEDLERYFSCPRCNERFGDEFWELNSDKYSKEMKNDEY